MQICLFALVPAFDPAALGVLALPLCNAAEALQLLCNLQIVSLRVM